jgi:hypothetical protein
VALHNLLRARTIPPGGPNQFQQFPQGPNVPVPGPPRHGPILRQQLRGQQPPQTGQMQGQGFQAGPPNQTAMLQQQQQQQQMQQPQGMLLIFQLFVV